MPRNSERPSLPFPARRADPAFPAAGGECATSNGEPGDDPAALDWVRAVDCRIVSRGMATNSVSLIVTAPPPLFHRRHGRRLEPRRPGAQGPPRRRGRIAPGGHEIRPRTGQEATRIPPADSERLASYSPPRRVRSVLLAEPPRSSRRRRAGRSGVRDTGRAGLEIRRSGQGVHAGPLRQEEKDSRAGKNVFSTSWAAARRRN